MDKKDLLEYIEMLGDNPEVLSDKEKFQIAELYGHAAVRTAKNFLEKIQPKTELPPDEALSELIGICFYLLERKAPEFNFSMGKEVLSRALTILAKSITNTE